MSPSERLRGVGSTLLTEVESRLSAVGCRWVQMGGTTWFYAWPGMDLAYTAALVAAEKAGFTCQSLVHNMDIDLISRVPTTARRGGEGAGGRTARRCTT